MVEGEKGEGRGRAVVRYVDNHLSPPQRLEVVCWAKLLLEIRHSAATPLRKARRALAATWKREVIVSLLSTTASSFKSIAWDDRSWSARLGLGAAAITVASVGGKSAGIAALGGAVGVPLWIVLGAGGSFAGMLIEELFKVLPDGKREDRQEVLAVTPIIVSEERKQLTFPIPSDNSG